MHHREERTADKRGIVVHVGIAVAEDALAVQRSFGDRGGSSGRSRSRVTPSSTTGRGQQPSATRVNPSAGASSNRSSSSSRQPGTGGGAPPIGSRYDSTIDVTQSTRHNQTTCPKPGLHKFTA